VSRLRNGLGLRLRDERRIALEILGGDDAVARAAQKQCGNVHPVQPMLELRIVHVRLPGQQRQRLAVTGEDMKLLLRHRRQVDRVLRGIVKAQLVELVLGHREHIRDVELVGRAGLDADRADQHQPLEPLRYLGGEVGGNPSADRQADNVGSRQTQAIHQFQIDVGDVVHAVEPVGQRRSSKTGMRWGDDAPLAREQIDEGKVERDAAATVQIEHRRAAAALEYLELDTRERDHV
jgi:hypothetical protein